jgi:hypothetical protein
MRVSKAILPLLLTPTILLGERLHFSELEDFLLKPAAAVATAVTKILDANDILWNKINTKQVNIAIDDLRENINAIDRAKRNLQDQIKKEQINEDQLRTALNNLKPMVQGLQTTLDRFGSSINEAAGSSITGDDLRRAADDLARGKLIIIDELPDTWRRSHSVAADKMQVAIDDTQEILRALNCLQTAINTGSRPKEGCTFGNAHASP